MIKVYPSLIGVAKIDPVYYLDLNPFIFLIIRPERKKNTYVLGDFWKEKIIRANRS